MRLSYVISVLSAISLTMIILNPFCIVINVRLVRASATPPVLWPRKSNGLL